MIDDESGRENVLARRPVARYTPPDLFLEDVDPELLHHAAHAVDAEFGLDYDAGFEAETERNDGTPSLAVILVSAACGVGGGVIGLYLSYTVLDWPAAWVAGVTTLGLLFSLGLSGAIMSVATGSRAAPANILFSCGLILAASLFMGLCLVFGALGATLLIR